MSSYCDLDVEKNGDLIVVRLGKHRVLDEATVNEISDELLGVPDRPDCHRLLLDFSGVASLSSAMLGKLVRLHRKVESRGEKLRLSGISSQLRSVFATTRLDRFFDIADEEAGTLKADAPWSMADARSAVKRSPSPVWTPSLMPQSACDVLRTRKKTTKP